MKQNKNLHKITLLTVSALLVLTAPKAFSITLDELTDPMPPAYRLGVSATPEKAYKVSDSEKKLQAKDANLDKTSEEIKNITYADLSRPPLSFFV